MPLEAVAGLQALAAIVGLAKVVARTENAPDEAKICLNLLELLHQEREHLIDVLNEASDALESKDRERIEEKLETSRRAIEDVGKLLQKYRPETRGGRASNIGLRIVWVIADAEAFSQRVPYLQMQQASLHLEIIELNARRRLGPVVAMAERVEEERRFENADLINSLLGKAKPTAIPTGARNSGTPVYNSQAPLSPVYGTSDRPELPRSFSSGFGDSLQNPLIRSVGRRSSSISLQLPETPPPSYQASWTAQTTTAAFQDYMGPGQANTANPLFDANPLVAVLRTDTTSPPLSSLPRKGLFSFPADTKDPIPSSLQPLPSPPPLAHAESFSMSSTLGAPGTLTRPSNNLVALFEASRKPISKLPTYTTNLVPTFPGSVADTPDPQRDPPSRSSASELGFGTQAQKPLPPMPTRPASLSGISPPLPQRPSPLLGESPPLPHRPSSLFSVSTTGYMSPSPELSPHRSRRPTTASVETIPPFIWELPGSTYPPKPKPVERNDTVDSGVGLSTLFSHNALMNDAVQPLVYEIDNSNRGFREIFELEVPQIGGAPCSPPLVPLKTPITRVEPVVQVEETPPDTQRPWMYPLTNPTAVGPAASGIGQNVAVQLSPASPERLWHERSRILQPNPDYFG